MTIRSALIAWAHQSLFAIIGILLVTGNALAAEKVSVRVGLHADFGRLVLEWPKPIRFSAVMNGDEIKIEFSRELEANLAQVRRRLGKYVRAARIENRKRIILKLTRPVFLRSRAAGRLVIVDLVDRPAAAGTAAREKVALRGGEHPGRSRLVFDWKKPSGYKVSRSEGKITIRFARPATFDRSRLQLSDLSRISAVLPSKDARSVVVSVTGNVSLKHFTAGAKVVLDIHEAEKPSRVKTKKETVGKKLAIKLRPANVAKKTALPPKTTKSATPLQSGDKSPLKIASKTKPVVLPKGTIRIGAASDLSKLNEAIEKLGLNAKNSAQPGSVDTATGSSGKIAGGQTGNLSKSGNPTTDGAGKSEKGQPKSNDKKQPLKEAITKTAPSGSASLSKELLIYIPNADATRLDVYGDEDEKGSRIIFPWQRPVAAAAFSRLGYVWVIFSQYAQADLTRVGRDAPSVLSAQQLRDRRFTVLRFRARPGLFARIRREQAVWILEFSGGAVRLQRELIPVARAAGDKGPQVYLPSLDNGDRVIIRDPDVGDELHVVPTMVSASGVASMRRYVDFDLLASLQGIVVRPKSDGVIVESKRERVLISSKQGLILSNPGLTVSADDKVLLGVSTGVPLLDLAGWRGSPEITFIEKRSEIRHALVLSPPGRRNEIRMKLARMMIGYDFSYEAAALLELVIQDDPSQRTDPTFLAIRGLSNLLSGRLPEAERDLKSPVLDKFPDIYLWRSMWNTKTGDFDTASKLFPVGANHLQEQPSRMRKKLLLNWLRTTSEIADDSNFDATVAALQPFKSDPKVTNTIAWLQGRQAQRRERYASALTFYDQVIAAGTRPYSAYARRDRVKVRLLLEQIGYRQAMDELERLRFAWRGDDFELGVTAWLADLNFEQKKYRRGLEVLQEVVKSYPKSKLTEAMTRRMREVFNELFLAKKADELRPISALALYYDFQELTPLGRKGDEMIRLLADRLANVDLLDRAATLLEHQVRFRLKGQEKSRVGTRLAVIYLLDNRPKKALQTLTDSEFGLLPAPLVRERRHLRVRALAEIGKIKPALALLKNDASDAAKQLRIDIHWNAQNWPAAAQTLDGYLGRRWAADLPLNPLEQRQVIQLAITRYLSDDAAGLVLVKERYGDKMKASPYFETFRVITHNIDPSKTRFRDLAPAIAGIPDFEAFMTSYREKIRSGGISALN